MSEKAPLQGRSPGDLPLASSLSCEPASEGRGFGYLTIVPNFIVKNAPSGFLQPCGSSYTLDIAAWGPDTRRRVC